MAENLLRAFKLMACVLIKLKQPVVVECQGVKGKDPYSKGEVFGDGPLSTSFSCFGSWEGKVPGLKN